jgi:hypothetical protein
MCSGPPANATSKASTQVGARRVPDGRPLYVVAEGEESRLLADGRTRRALRAAHNERGSEPATTRTDSGAHLTALQAHVRILHHPWAVGTLDSVRAASGLLTEMWPCAWEENGILTSWAAEPVDRASEDDHQPNETHEKDHVGVTSEQ